VHQGEVRQREDRLEIPVMTFFIIGL
jgi:hypothetical protein